MASNSAKFIQLSDGTSVEEAIIALQGSKGIDGASVDLSGYAKTSDIKEVKDMIDQLVSDLKAGKYNVISEVNKVEEVKEETVKASK